MYGNPAYQPTESAGGRGQSYSLGKLKVFPLTVEVCMCMYQILLHANHKGTDQPVHTHRLVNAFVIRYLKSKVVKLVTYLQKFNFLARLDRSH